MSKTSVPYSQRVQDRLDHQHAASVLTNAIQGTDLPATFALFGHWGRGKTDVLHRLEENLISSNTVKVVWANPWQSGHGDVLSCISSAIAKNHVDKWQPQELKRLMIRVARVGAAFTTRVVARPLIEAHGIDTDAAIDAIEKAAADDELKELLKCTPTELAAEAIRSICKRAFGNSRVIVLIDDLDRCPPSWQKALVESLHFLKSIDYPIAFVVAIDKNSIFAGAHAIGASYGDLGALTCKVFDCSFELHDAGRSLEDWLIDAFAQPKSALGNRSVQACFSILREIPSDQVRIDRFAAGICSSMHLRTPRNVERSLLRAVSIMASGTMSKEDIDCTCSDDMHALGFVISARDRYPDLTGWISTRLSQELKTMPHSIVPGYKEEKGYILNCISELQIEDHRNYILDVLQSACIQVSSNSIQNCADASQYGLAIERASIVCNRALL